MHILNNLELFFSARLSFLILKWLAPICHQIPLLPKLRIPLSITFGPNGWAAGWRIRGGNNHCWFVLCRLFGFVKWIVLHFQSLLSCLNFRAPEKLAFCSAYCHHFWEMEIFSPWVVSGRAATLHSLFGHESSDQHGVGFQNKFPFHYLRRQLRLCGVLWWRAAPESCLWSHTKYPSKLIWAQFLFNCTYIHLHMHI